MRLFRSLALPSYAGACAFALLFLIASYNTWVDPDVWGHLSRGEEILRTGNFAPNLHFTSDLAWNPVNHYWLFQALAAMVYRSAGPFGVTLFVGLAWAVMLFGLALLIRPLKSGAPGWLWLGSGLLLFHTRFLQRPEAFSFAIIAIDIFLVDQWSRFTKKWPIVVAMLGLQIVAANMHGYFFVPIAVVGLRGLCYFSDRSARTEARKQFVAWSGLAFGLFAVSTITPFGVHTWWRVFEQWQELRGLGAAIVEVQPFSWEVVQTWPYPLFAGVWLGTALIAYFRFTESFRLSFPVALAVAGLWFSRTGIRMNPFLFLFAAPLWGDYLVGFSLKLKWQRYAGYGMATLFLLIAVSIQQNYYYKHFRGLTRFGTGLAEFAPARHVEKFLGQTNYAGTIFNHPTDGSYLKFKHPALRLYADSLMTGAAATAEYGLALTRLENFHALLETRPQDALLFQVDFSAGILPILLKSGSWNLAYADVHAAMFTNKNHPRLATSDFPFRYFGEDLRELPHGKAAIFWTEILIASGQRAFLLTFLEEIGKGPHVPSPILESVLVHLQSNPDSEVRRAVLKLRPKMYILDPEDAAVVDELIRNTASVASSR